MARTAETPCSCGLDRSLLAIGAVSVERKLGDEWRDWDGESRPAETRAGKRLFFKLSSLSLLLLAGALWLTWYLVAPRLAQWHSLVPAALLAAFAVVVTLLGLQMSAVIVSLWAGWRLPRPLTGLARRLLVSSEKRVFALARRLAVDRDRLAHSLIKINNELVRRDEPRTSPERVLILLPRCLTREQIQAARELAASHGVHVAVVAGGELARQRIRELKPRAVIGVACERDLVSGLRDAGARLDVLGIPNHRPNGPCKDTTIDLDQLGQAIALCVGGPPAPP